MIIRLLYVFVGLLVYLQSTATNADIALVEGHDLRNGGTIQGHGSLLTGIKAWTVVGDTYGADPLAQDTGERPFISPAVEAPHQRLRLTRLMSCTVTT